MDDDPSRAVNRFEGPPDQLLAGLGEHLDGHVLGNPILLDQLSNEGKIRFGGARESHLDLLEAELDELLEEAPLALGTHGLDQCLVAIAKVDAAPDRWPLDHAVRPAPIGQVDGPEGLVFGGGHARHGSLQVRRGVRLEREGSQR
jgi:hypothetical protein